MAIYSGRFRCGGGVGRCNRCCRWQRSGVRSLRRRSGCCRRGGQLPGKRRNSGLRTLQYARGCSGIDMRKRIRALDHFLYSRNVSVGACYRFGVSSRLNFFQLHCILHILCREFRWLGRGTRLRQIMLRSLQGTYYFFYRTAFLSGQLSGVFRVIENSVKRIDFLGHRFLRLARRIRKFFVLQRITSFFRMCRSMA